MAAPHHNATLNNAASSYTTSVDSTDLRAAGCFWVWTDTASGASTDRPKLTELFDQLRFGDTLVVWRLDRLGRSLPHLIETIRVLEAREVGFKSVQEDIDTTTPGGRLVFHVFSALASFELELVRERTMAGLASARARGRLGGRPSVMSAAIVAAGVEAVIYDAGRRYRTEPEGRAECLRGLVEDAATAPGHTRLVIEQDDSLVSWDSQRLIELSRLGLPRPVVLQA